MKRWCIIVIGTGLALFIVSLGARFRQAPVTPVRPINLRNTQFITVEANVELEVVDFGGTGRPLVLVPGYGATAHSFPKFSTDLAKKYHVYAITQRGCGLSSSPASGYGAQRLGDDVVAVIDALKLVRPVIVGESVAGEVLSSLAKFHSERVAGLVYLDAANWYALYDLETSQPMVNLWFAVIAGGRIIEPLIPSAIESKSVAMLFGMMKFTELHVPVLAIFADPHDLSRKFKDPGQREKAEEIDFERAERQANAFQRQVPQARIIRLPHAAHLVFISNEADVLNAMDAFIDSLPGV